jgi:hypothetical protein
LVDSAIKSAVSGFSELYGSRVGAQLVGVSAFPEIDESAKTAIVEKLPSDADFTTLPQIFLRNYESKDVKKFCNTLRETLDGFVIDCPEANSLYALRFGTLASNSTNSTSVSSSDIALYQISLWLTVALILALYAAIYGFVYMDTKYDNTLYTKFNPKAYGKGPAK